MAATDVGADTQGCAPTDKDDLPTTIIIREVPAELYSDSEMQTNFESMFTQITNDLRVDYLKGFRRVRVVFQEPEHATAAKLLIEHHKFNGIQLKAAFGQNIKMKRVAYQDEQGHLTLPPLEKQFLISPPSSPPVGWEQCREMAPVVCSFDLMARLAAYTDTEKYEVHGGGGDTKHPTIVVTPAKGDDGLVVDDEAIGIGPLPHTPRPPADGEEEGEDISPDLSE